MRQHCAEWQMGREVLDQIRCGDASAGKDQSKPDDEEWRSLRRNGAKVENRMRYPEKVAALGFGPPLKRFDLPRSLAVNRMRMNSKAKHWLPR